MAEFEQLVAAAREHGLEIALDFAIQMSPDHPWLRSTRRGSTAGPDGSLKYAENPPKRYQDIHSVDWDTPSGRRCGMRSATSCSGGARAACAPTGSTTRTRSPFRSGSG